MKNVFPGYDQNQYQKALQSWGRAQDMDYMARFRPREDFLINYATDAGLAAKEAGEAGAFVNKTFADAPAVAERQLGRLGITQTPEQKAAAARSAEYQRGLSEVDAMNRTSVATVNRQREVLGALV